MKRRPESVMYYSSKNGLPNVYDDNDTIFNGINDKVIQDNIQDEELELSAALSIASKAIVTIPDNLQELDVLSDCEVQLTALQKKYLYNSNHGMNFKILLFIFYIYIYIYNIFIILNRYKFYY